MIKSRSARWVLVILFWTVVGLFFASQVYFISVYRGEPHPWQRTLLWTMPDWYIWAALTPLALMIAKRYRLERDTGIKNLVVHIPASILFAVVHLAIYTPIQVLLNPTSARPLGMGEMFQFYLFTRIHFNIITYAVIVGIWYAFDYYRKLRERELTMSRLQGQLAQSHLRMLKMQLQPHFLFNTLNSISALMHIDVEKADRMLARLGDLLRATLRNDESQFVTLRRELDILRTYLEIEQIRLGDRLSITFRIDDDVLDAEVPNLLMQPLVENAIKHGIGPNKQAGTIEVSAHRENGSLMLKIQDDGVGVEKAKAIALAGGVGLSNTRNRLSGIYGSDHQLRILSGSKGGFAVTISIPFRTPRF